ncbi:MAG: cell division protein FtsA [Bacteroidales bacterium]|nr:cell division protein FtsA [Bacteroidales bacterium]
MEERYIASIDLGTSKFGLCVARVKGDDVQVVYYRETPSAGIRASVVQNPMKASVPLRKAIEEAENELMIKILQVVVGMPRSDVRQETATGGIVRSNPDEYITEEEVENLKAMALESYPLSDLGSQIMYGAVAQSFSIDDQIQLVENDVVGTLSKELEGNFKVFIGSRRATTAVDKIFNSMGIAIAKKYFLPDVVAKTVLTEEDRQNGVALVDIGAGVTSVAIYQGGIMRSYDAIPFGGKTITGDLRTECSISEDLAEKIKLKFGACMPGKLASLSEKVLQIRLTEPYKEVSVKYISEVIDARCREIINAVLYYIQESGLAKNLRSGIVLTGGGASLVNFANLFKEISGYEVRIGFPRHLFSASVGAGIYDPSATSAIGMILAAKDDRMPDCVTRPAPDWADAPEAESVQEEEEETVEVTEGFFVPDPTYNEGEQGTLIPEEEYGEVPAAAEEPTEEKKAEKKKKEPKAPRKPKPPRMFWKNLSDNVKNGVLKFYDEMTKEDE